MVPKGDDERTAPLLEPEPVATFEPLKQEGVDPGIVKQKDINFHVAPRGGERRPRPRSKQELNVLAYRTVHTVAHIPAVASYLQER